MIAKDTFHVAPHDGSWAVKRQGNERSSSTHPTQKEAIDAARELAHDGDEVVIHRSDGTIRQHETYSEPGVDSSSREKLRPSDVMSVGSRVSWSAVIAGVVVATAIYITLYLLFIAIWLTSFDPASQTFALGAAIGSAVCLLIALFMGGCVASHSSVGEDKTEAMTYGVLVWATMILLLGVTGFTLGVGFFDGIRDLGTTINSGLTVRPDVPHTWTASPLALAWWTFGGAVLSMFAAVLGALAGAGPELVLKHIRSKRVAGLSRS